MVTTFANDVAFMSRTILASKFIAVAKFAAFTSFPTSGDKVETIVGLNLIGKKLSVNVKFAAPLLNVSII